MATATGGAIVVYDDFTAAVRQLTTRHFNSAGDQLFTNIGLYQRSQFAINLHLVKPSLTGNAFTLYSHFARPDLDENEATYEVQYVQHDGRWITATFGYATFLEGVIFTRDNHLARVHTRPWDNEMTFRIGALDKTIPVAAGEQLLDFSLASTRDSHMLFSYTRRGQQPGCPGEVWTAGGRIFDNVLYSFDPLPAQDATYQDQFNSRLTDLGTENMMLSWLQTLDGVNSLHVKSISYSGAELSTPRQTVENVVDYVATSSTLGLPVFAAVQRDNTAAAPMDTLMGGLINPGNGGTLTIPVATGPDVKVKDLRQVTNGDFRLAYSTLEGGTNLLKVRGISGITGGTLWEATVADLGRGSDEIVDTYPNTFVESNGDSVLYILARYDQPGTANSLFQMVRLRADGTMGGE